MNAISFLPCVKVHIDKLCNNFESPHYYISGTSEFKFMLRCETLFLTKRSFLHAKDEIMFSTTKTGISELIHNVK